MADQEKYQDPQSATKRAPAPPEAFPEELERGRQAKEQERQRVMAEADSEGRDDTGEETSPAQASSTQEEPTKQPSKKAAGSKSTASKADSE